MKANQRRHELQAPDTRHSFAGQSTNKRVILAETFDGWLERHSVVASYWYRVEAWRAPAVEVTDDR